MLNCYSPFRLTSLIYTENIYINKSVILKDNRITIQEFGSAQD